MAKTNPSVKADKVADKKAGIKENSAQDKKLDAGATKKPKLGTGVRFTAGVDKMTSKGMPKKEAAAIMANAGRDAHGATAMNRMAAAGRKRVKK